ncbi:MAG: hypothetical protein LBS59_00030 [Puniceicoccales bacterium]|jgi:hypothetical protein|nr:hypothetical protein [Puniceicoccales bacterium]
MPDTEITSGVPDSLKDVTPNPWIEVLKLRHGEDRSFAHVIESKVLTAVPAEFPELEKRLIAILKNKNASLLAKEFACRMLALIGSEACVPVVAPLLSNKQLAHFARMALAPISGKKVDTALREALPKISGPEKQGLLATIASREKKLSAL